MQKRIHNFSAGPSAIPLEVLEKAQSELINFQDAGMSIMEMSHRSKVYESVLEKAKERFNKLYSIPETHEVLFLHGGASLQFAMIPMNFYKEGKPVDVINTGVWTKKAIKELNLIGKANVFASGEDVNFTSIPDIKASDFNPEASYAYITTNNTIFGTQYHEFPDTGNIPLVADMSSDILSKKVDVSKFGLIFAGAQKNLGPSGLAVVIVNKDWVKSANENIPSMLSYQTHIENNSLYNTPNTWGVYMVGLVLEWIEKKGGLEVVQKENEKKAKLLYDYLDASEFYTTPINKKDRSNMNVVFRIGTNEELEKKFVQESNEEGLNGLKGHRLIGGLRASIYNAVSEESIQSLISFMKSFEKKHALSTASQG